jgi:hypothetical protein
MSITYEQPAATDREAAGPLRFAQAVGLRQAYPLAAQLRRRQATN